MSKSLIGVVAALVLCAAACSEGQPSVDNAASPTTLPALQPTTTTEVATESTVPAPATDTELGRPSELATPAGWRIVAELPEAFVVRSVAATDAAIYLVGGADPARVDEPVRAEEILRVDRASSLVRSMDWPSESRGDIVAVGEAIVLATDDGLFELDAVTDSWAQVADGSWVASWATSFAIVSATAWRWSPDSGLDQIAPLPTSRWISLAGTGDELFLLSKGGFWEYVSSSGAWEARPQPPLYSEARAMIATDGQVIAADYEMDAMRWNVETRQWEALPDLPLRFYGCLPTPIDLVNVAGFLLCSGTAIWVGEAWITIPLAGGVDGSWHLAGRNEMLALHAGTIVRYTFPVDSATWGLTVPIGVYQFDVPIGWSITSQVVDGEHAFSNVIATALSEPSGESCVLRSIKSGFVPSNSERHVTRRGQERFADWQDDTLVVSDRDRGDVTEITCTEPASAELMADHIWSLYEPANHLISGTMPSGLGFDVLTQHRIDGEPVGLSAGLVIEPSDAVPGTGGVGPGELAFQGAAEFGAASVDVEGNTIEATSGDWKLRLQVDDDTQELSGLDTPTIAAAITPGKPTAGLPTFQLTPPLAWSSDELPVETLVEYKAFDVRRIFAEGYTHIAVACSGDNSLEVITKGRGLTPDDSWTGGIITIHTG